MGTSFNFSDTNTDGSLTGHVDLISRTAGSDFPDQWIYWSGIYIATQEQSKRGNGDRKIVNSDDLKRGANG
jgi:hypothetical protein